MIKLLDYHPVNLFHPCVTGSIRKGFWLKLVLYTAKAPFYTVVAHQNLTARC